MRDVNVGHDQVVAADNGVPAAQGRAGMQRAAFADDVPSPTRVVFSPLYFRSCGIAHHRAREDMHSLAQRGVTGEGHVVMDDTVFANRTSGPMTEYGPIATPSAICALGSTTAVGWILRISV